MNYDKYPFIRVSDGERISQYGVDLWELKPDEYTHSPRPEFEIEHSDDNPILQEFGEFWAQTAFGITPVTYYLSLVERNTDQSGDRIKEAIRVLTKLRDVVEDYYNA